MYNNSSGMDNNINSLNNSYSFSILSLKPTQTNLNKNNKFTEE